MIRRNSIDRDSVARALLHPPELSGVTDAVVAAAEAVCSAFAEGSRLFVCGNGGSASDAEHIVGELAKSYRRKRPLSEAVRRRMMEVSPELGAPLSLDLEVGLPAFSLVSQTSLLTAVCNDIGGDAIFAQQVVAYATEGDCVIGLTTSGRSKNVINAFIAAKAVGALTIALTGSEPSAAGSFADVVIAAPALATASVQQLHQIIYHTLCDAVEYAFFGEDCHAAE